MRQKSIITAHHNLRVRYSETDQMGIVYHANYFVWFHEARDALVRRFGLFPAEMEREGWGFPVVEATCRYYAPARYGDEISIKSIMHIQKVARMDIEYVVRRNGCNTRLASGLTKSVIIGRDGKMILRMPDRFWDLLQSVLIDVAPAKVRE